MPLNESILSYVTFWDDHFHFYVPSFFTEQLKRLTTLAFAFVKCSRFMAKNASKAYTKNKTSRKQTRQPGFTDGNDNGP